MYVSILYEPQMRKYYIQGVTEVFNGICNAAGLDSLDLRL